MANLNQQKDTELVGKKVEIAEDELMELQAQATQRQRTKTDLRGFEPAIKKMMELDISLPLVLGWLEKKGKTTTLPALRRYVRNAFGEDFYNDFARRNGWKKTKRKAKVLEGSKGDEIKPMETGAAVEQVVTETTDELIRPPGISNSAWADLQAKHRAEQRNRT